MKRITALLHKERKRIITYSVVGIIAVAFLLLFFDLIVALGTVLFFILTNIVLRFYRRILVGLPIELEVVIFGAVIVTVAFNVWMGLFLAFFAALLAEFLSQSISPYSFINIFSYLLVPIMSLFIAIENIATGGFIIAIIINLIIYIAFMIIGYDYFKNTAYLVTNIFWNYLLFFYLAEFVVSILV